MADYSLRDLRCLDALLDECHVSRAAARMGVSQPAMSMQLARLRDLFGDPLLVRRGSGLQPTDAARDLHGRVQEMIRSMEGLVEPRGGFDPTAGRHRFTLILTDYIDTILVPRLMARFDAVGADVALRVVGPNPLRIGELFNEGIVDLTVSYFPRPPQNLVSRRVFSDRMVCMARRGHPALEGVMTLERFCALDHVAVEPAEASMYRLLLDDALAALGQSRRIALAKPDFNGVPFLLEASDAVAAMPARLAEQFARRFDLVAFDPPLDLPALDIRMMWHPGTRHSAPHRWLRAQVLAVIAGEGAAAPDC